MTREVLAGPVYEEDFGMANLIGVIRSINNIIENPVTPVAVKSEGGQISNNLTSIDFRGSAVHATSDTQGNVIVTVDASVMTVIVDGGIF